MSSHAAEEPARTEGEELAARFPLAWQVFSDGRSRGLHHGVQFCIWQQGLLQASGAWGEVRPGEPLSIDHWLLWLSAGKPLTAVLIAQLWERGALDWEDPVCRFIPEFGTQGKEAITIRHLLTHMAGLRTIDTGWPDCDWDTTIQRICAADLDAGAVPGATPGYHTASTWFLLGEIIQRIVQQPFAEVLQRELLQPCGMTRTRIALSRDEQLQLGSTLAPLWERQQGALTLLDWHQPPRVERPSPGSSLRGPISDLARFYEMLRCGGTASGVAVLRPETVALVIRRQRVGLFDQTLGHMVDFGLGVIIDSNKYGAETVPYGYGRYCSPETYGHGGAQSSQGYCDPRRELVVSYVFNGRAGEPQHNRRCRQFNEALYRDLGLAD